MSRPFPRICATCREWSVQLVNLPSHSTTVEHDGRSYVITLADVSGTRCDNCGALILDDSVADRVDDQLREQVGLLHPAEIRNHRQALGLTQKVLAQKLQIGEATLSRWETGAQIQQRSLDLLLRLCFDLVNVQQYLGITLSEQSSRPVATQTVGSVPWLPVTKELQPSLKANLTWQSQTHRSLHVSPSQEISGYDSIPETTGPKLRMAS